MDRIVDSFVKNHPREAELTTKYIRGQCAHFALALYDLYPDDLELVIIIDQDDDAHPKWIKKYKNEFPFFTHVAVYWRFHPMDINGFIIDIQGKISEREALYESKKQGLNKEPDLYFLPREELVNQWMGKSMLGAFDQAVYDEAMTIITSHLDSLNVYYERPKQ